MRKILLFSIAFLCLNSFVNAQDATLTGTVQTIDSENIGDVSVSIFDATGVLIENVIATGGFTFSGLTEGESYLVTFEKDDDQLNGVSTLDLVIIMKHILNLTSFDSPYKVLSADVNESQTVTVFDLVLMRKLILAQVADLPIPSWQFLPANIPAGENPLGNYTFNEIEVTMNATDENIEVTGIKMGDVNASAQPE